MSLEPTRRSFGLSYDIAWLTHDRSAQPGSNVCFRRGWCAGLPRDATGAARAAKSGRPEGT